VIFLVVVVVELPRLLCTVVGQKPANSPQEGDDIRRFLSRDLHGHLVLSSCVVFVFGRQAPPSLLFFFCLQLLLLSDFQSAFSFH